MKVLNKIQQTFRVYKKVKSLNESIRTKEVRLSNGDNTLSSYSRSGLAELQLNRRVLLEKLPFFLRGRLG